MAYPSKEDIHRASLHGEAILEFYWSEKSLINFNNSSSVSDVYTSLSSNPMLIQLLRGHDFYMVYRPERYPMAF